MEEFLHLVHWKVIKSELSRKKDFHHDQKTKANLEWNLGLTLYIEWTKGTFLPLFLLENSRRESVDLDEYTSVTDEEVHKRESYISFLKG